MKPYCLLIVVGLVFAQDTSSSTGTRTEGSDSAQGRRIVGSSQSDSGNPRLFGGPVINALIGAGAAVIGGLLSALGNPSHHGFGERVPLVGPPVGGFGHGFGNVGPGVFGTFQGRPVGGFGNFHVRPVGGFGHGNFVGGFGQKPGFCPPARPHCPPVRNFGVPQTCRFDINCGGTDKCCLDTCLQQTVCKPSSGQFG